MPNRSHWAAKLGRLNDPEPEPGYSDSGKNLEMMWSLTLDNWAFMKEPHAESRLQRHVVRLIRGKG
jgi:hypothetical protein